MKKMSLVVILVFSFCSPYQKYFRYDFKEDDAKLIKTVVVTPIDMIRMRPQGTNFQMINKLETSIKDYIINNRYNVISNKVLIENWINEVKKIDGFFDPATGKIDASKINGCLIVV